MRRDPEGHRWLVQRGRAHFSDARVPGVSQLLLRLVSNFRALSPFLAFLFFLFFLFFEEQCLFLKNNLLLFIYLAVSGFSCGTWDLWYSCGLWHLSLRDWTLSWGTWDLVPWRGIDPWAPCIGNTEPKPLDHQESPSLPFFLLLLLIVTQQFLLLNFCPHPLFCHCKRSTTPGITFKVFSWTKHKWSLWA